MIICSKCKGSAIQAKFPDVLSLVSRVYIEGELENEINKELEMHPPKLSKWEVAWSGTDLTKLDIGEAVSLVCKSCGKEGTLEDFELVNSCRCRNITDDITLCRKFTCMACKNCVDLYECRHCRHTTCKYNSKYKGENPPKEEPRQRRERYIGNNPFEEELRSRVVVDPPPIDEADARLNQEFDENFDPDEEF